jgi:hypothetical protein
MDSQRAEEFCRSYGAASLRGDAIEVAGHYAIPFTAFTLGSVTTFADREEADRNVAEHLGRFGRVGLGTGIALEGLEVRLLSETSAVCHLTWHIDPENGAEPWSWTNVYLLREAADGTLQFEASIADNEILELLTRVPEFFAS